MLDEHVALGFIVMAVQAQNPMRQRLKRLCSYAPDGPRPGSCGRVAQQTPNMRITFRATDDEERRVHCKQLSILAERLLIY
jgi:hypothetical protein